MSTSRLVKYEAMGDPDDDYTPTKRDLRRQAQAQEIREWAAREVEKAPPMTPAQIDRVVALLRHSAVEPDLMTWRLRLICGHVTQRTAHASYPTIERAFNGSVHECPDCRLSPAVIVAGKPLINAD